VVALHQQHADEEKARKAAAILAARPLDAVKL
jgi:hypothetical protein